MHGHMEARNCEQDQYKAPAWARQFMRQPRYVAQIENLSSGFQPPCFETRTARYVVYVPEMSSRRIS
jgi:hypothetical protein